MLRHVIAVSSLAMAATAGGAGWLAGPAAASTGSAGAGAASAAGRNVGPGARHGAGEDPMSRQYRCYTDKNIPACQAAIAETGGYDGWIYEWKSVLQTNAAGRPLAVIPDGRLCSGGTQDKEPNYNFKGLDLARPDWPVTELTPGSDYTFKYKNDTGHLGTWEYYLTKPEYDPASRPLRWSDLETTPFLILDATAPGGWKNPEFLAALPDVHGKRIIYVIWQRSTPGYNKPPWANPDSGEAFYECDDVNFR